MTECSKCGEESMSFTCKYCGEKFCSKHRLPEKHGCEGLEEGIEKEKQSKDSEKWFEDKKVKNPAPSQQKQREFRKPSLTGDLKRSIFRNATLSIIAFTSLFFMLQLTLGNSLSAPFYDLLVLDPRIENVVSQPWTLVTVMFLHGSFFHIFANMVTFYFFGSPVERIVGGKELLKFYFGAGIAASLGFVVFRNLLYQIHGPALACMVEGMCGGPVGVLGPAVGASGAVVAAFAAVSKLYPDAEVLLYFIIPLKIKTALYLFGGFEFINMMTKVFGYSLPYVGGFASSAHLVGLLVGVWFGNKLSKEINTRRSTFELVGR